MNAFEEILRSVRDLENRINNPEGTWFWTTVSSTSPIRVKLDIDDDALPVEVINLSGSLYIGKRVWCQMFNGRVLIHGPVSTSGGGGGLAVYDSGWQAITPVSGITAIESLAWRKIGNIVYLRGGVSRSTAFPNSGGPVAVFTLPEGARPATFLRTTGTTYQNATVYNPGVNINTSGVVEVFSNGTATDNTRFSGLSFPVVGAFGADAFGQGDTGWKPHGGTLASGINVVGPIEYRIIGPMCYWRGQFYKTGGWAANGAVNTVITNLPAEVRPQTGYGGALETTTDTAGKFAAKVNELGELLVYSGHTGIWPVIGGGYPLATGIGAPLAPPADTGWTNITFTNSWTAYGAYTPQYRVRNGVTEMRGLIARSAGAPAADSTIFTLPTWAAPELGLVQRHFACRCSTAAAVSGLAVKSDGTVMYQNGAVGWISLDQITYTAQGQ